MPNPAPRTLDCRGRLLTFAGESLIVGILNVTPDSFSDGGSFYDASAAVAQAERMVAEGAAAIDLGGQSTRPGHTEISEDEEIARVLPVLKALLPRVSVPISIDTYKPGVARAALEAGAHLLNDVFGLQGSGDLASIAAAANAPVIAMHQEANFKDAPGDTLAKMQRFFARTVEVAKRAGFSPGRVIFDPGAGFGKTQTQNLELVARLAEMRSWGHPVLLGTSRKSMIGNVLNLPVDQRLEGTLATTALAAWAGVELIRVHDVAANVRVAKMVAAIRATLSP